jgi:hypothetical protein
VSDKPTDRDLDVTVPGKPNAVVRDRPSLPPARYVAGDEIARGGMGRVALATDTLLERTVAVKQALTLDPEMLRRFARETKITARLEHPSIVPVYDAGTDGDAPFYVMRRVSGQPLSELILVSSSFEARIALVPNLLAAAQAVAHAHARGIVHRDIKPANILVGTLGETVVIDWGLAKVVDEPDDDDPIEQAAGDSLRTRVGTVFGTPGFMSPKQLRGEAVGYAADVYALGASLYFLLSGKPPHHAPTGEAMMELAAEGPPMPLAELVPGVPRELAAIVDTALAYGDRRYLDASAFAEDLRRFSTGQLVAAHHYSSRERLVRFLRKHRAAVAIGMIALAVIAVGATLSFQRVLAERDRADAEAAEAVAAREQERERADQLTLIRARMLVDTNPTEAIALLKDIDPTSRRLAEAHGLASAAMMRGVPWGMPPPGTATAIVELSPDGERLLQTTIAGELFVWDLTKRTLVLKRDFGKGFGLRGIWLGNRILVHGRVVPALLDPDTDTLQPVDLPKVHQILVSNDQTFNVALDGTGAVLFDRDGKVTGRPWPGHQVKGAAVTGNGAYLALVSDREMVVLSRDGKEVATRTGKLGLVYASRTNRIAIRDDLDIWELELGPTPKWTKLETSMFHKIVMSLAYRGDELLVAMASGHILALRAGKLFELERVSGTMAFLSEAGQGDFLYALGQSQLLHLHDGGSPKDPAAAGDAVAADRGATRGRSVRGREQRGDADLRSGDPPPTQAADPGGRARGVLRRAHADRLGRAVVVVRPRHRQGDRHPAADAGDLAQPRGVSRSGQGGAHRVEGGDHRALRGARGLAGRPADLQRPAGRCRRDPRRRHRGVCPQPDAVGGRHAGPRADHARHPTRVARVTPLRLRDRVDRRRARARHRRRRRRAPAAVPPRRHPQLCPHRSTDPATPRRHPDRRHPRRVGNDGVEVDGSSRARAHRRRDAL